MVERGPGVIPSGRIAADALSCIFTIVIHSTARRSGSSPEARLAAWWRAGRGATGGWLVADDGSRWRVRHPGRVNHDAGPDFVEAVLEAPPGTAIRGAVVELHHRASDWQAHRHDRNPRYNTVTLHLILVENRPGIPTLAANGRRIPRVVIDPARLPAAPARPTGRQQGDAGLWRYGCRLPGAVGRDRQRAAHVIGAAGDIRLAWLTRIFRLDLVRATLDGEPALPASQIVEQVLYEGIADALGFSQNRTAMRQLARSVPLAALPRAAPPSADYPDTLASAATTLLTAAKLVPATPSRPPRQLPLLAGAAEPPSAGAARHSVHPPPWQANRTRPGNAPVRRIVALATLAVSWPPQGLGQAVLRCLAANDPAGGQRRARSWQTLAALVRQPAPPPAVVRHLRRLGVWSEEEVPTAIIGASRAADIVVNVLLPHSLAVARDGPPGTGQRARRVFLEHPLLAENWITRLMSKRTGFRARTAREQQGLIRLYEHYSHSLFCRQCPLGETLPTTET